MHLIKPQSVREAEAPSPASVFAEKYDWLLRWALHFTQNDAALAEDLVQDSFVRLILSWPRIKDNIHQVEAFLYSTLRYIHLMGLRRGRRMILQDIELIEFDDLQQTLREEKSVHPIEVQDRLRRVVAFLCWRKRTVKSASVLLLRFFHGYSPDEIALMAIMRRQSANKLLQVARQDVKAYLADPNAVDVLHRDRMPEPMPRRVAVTQESFAGELQNTIAQARISSCMSLEQLIARYKAPNPRPIPVDLLAHLASCARCLDIVHTLFNFPKHGSGLLSDSASAGFSKTAQSKSSPEKIRRSIASGLDRFRKVYDHHPRGLMIAVNGEVIAMRDVNSSSSELKVPIALDKSLGIIDVLSEQGLTLLTLYVPDGPPEAPPEVCSAIELSDNRKLDLIVRFNSEGAVIELHYADPGFECSTAREDAELAEDASVEDGEHGGMLLPSPAPRNFWQKRFSDWFASLSMPEMSPLLATAMACALAAVFLFVLSVHRSSVIKPEELMTRAAAAELASQKNGQVGVVVQAVRIRTPKRHVERTVYRDAEGRRYPKPKDVPDDDIPLAGTLAMAGVSWGDPLSPASFDYWHDHAKVQHDSVDRTGDGLLTLTTTVADSNVVSESFTVRASDFHVIGRTIQLRDQGTIEIAEVSYGVVPWNSINSDVFDMGAVDSISGREALPSVLPHFTQPLMEIQLDEAELSVRLVLNHLRMDDSNGIRIERQADGIHIRGVVASAEEKYGLQSELKTVPHVFPAISTIAEMDSHPPAGAEITSVRQSSGSNTPSSLERFLVERGVDNAQSGPLTEQFISSSFAAKHESQALSDLLERFAAGAQLSASARTSLSQLIVQHKAALLTALQTEQRQLAALQLANGEMEAAIGPVQNNSHALRDAAEKNFSLCMELTHGNNDSSRPARIIAPQLVASIIQLRSVTLRISAASQLSTAETASPHESR